MGNMSYCRFQNTLSDLEDCADVLNNQQLTDTDEHDELLSRDEFNAAIELIEKCRMIAEQFEDVDLDDERMEFEQLKNEE